MAFTLFEAVDRKEDAKAWQQFKNKDAEDIAKLKITKQGQIKTHLKNNFGSYFYLVNSTLI